MDTNDNTDLKSTLVLDLCQGILESPDPNHADMMGADRDEVMMAFIELHDLATTLAKALIGEDQP
jgi:hypothetical protein